MLNPDTTAEPLPDASPFHIVYEDDTLKLDQQVQFTCVGRILKAEEDGRLIGQECPVFDCHTFPAHENGVEHAEALTRQLNHLSELLGVLGFQVSYQENERASDSTLPLTGHFQVRVFALSPPNEEQE